MEIQNKVYQKKNKIIDGIREGYKVKGNKIYRIKFLRELGWTYLKIARHLEMGKDTIFAWCKKLGIKPKKSKDKKGNKIKTSEKMRNKIISEEKQNEECLVITCHEKGFKKNKGFCEKHFKEFEEEGWPPKNNVDIGEKGGKKNAYKKER